MSVLRSAGWLTVAAGVVGVVNLAYAVLMSWALPQGQYAGFLSGQALLLVCGTLANASIPWVLSRQLARSTDPVARSSAISFATIVTVALGAAAGLIVAGAAEAFASGPIPVAVGVAAFLTFAAAAVVGYLQGAERFASIARYRIVDALAKVLGGAALVLLFGAGAAGALAAFGLGSVVILCLGARGMLRELLHGLATSSLRERELWRQAAGLTLVQGGVALLANLDLVLASVPAAGGGSGYATYQVSVVLSRIPFFFAGAISMAAFPRLAREGDVLAVPASRDAFVRGVVPVAFAVATLPAVLSALLLPRAYAGGLQRFLPYTVAAASLVGLTNLVTTYFQAQARFRTCVTVLAAGILFDAAAVVAGMRVAGPLGIAAGAAAGQALTAGLLLARTPRLWSHAGSLLGSLAVAVTSSVPLLLLKPWPLPWLLYALPLGLFTFWFAFFRSPGPRGGGAGRPIALRGLVQHRSAGSP